MEKNTHKYQIIIVGAGISGLVLAERYASIGKKVLVIEKRNHIGGNCYDYLNQHGILVSKYGAHLFHTNYDHVWKYLQNFSEWISYEHRVVASVNGQLVPVPVNIETVNKILKLNITNSDEMDDWLSKNQVKIESPKNGEEMALSRVGRELYKLIFEGYTKKQWSKHPKELDASVLARIPVRNNMDDRYFSDKYQAQPANGFTSLFKNMISSKRISVLLETDFFDIKDQINDYEKLFYSGPVDDFFKKKSEKSQLEYRSIEFKFETYNQEYYQSNSVINYPNDHSYTRIVEYKHITGQKHPQTTISKEYPTNNGEPYYPVLTKKNRDIYRKYKSQVDKLENIHFIGRLAEYRYINMDEAFHNALNLFKRLQKN